jgi:hypothetical protein
VSIRNERNPKYVRLTRALAKAHQEFEESPGNRDFSADRLKRLCHEIFEGRFRHPVWALCYCKQTKKWYRLNGNHSSQLFLNLTDEEIEQNGREIFIAMEWYECDTLDDVAILYSTFDSKLNGRVQGDTNKSFAKTNDLLKDTPMSIVNRCGSALSMTEGVEYSTLNHTDRGALLVKHSDFVVWAHELFSRGASYAHMDRAPVFKAMYLTFKQNPRVAREFWSLVREGGPAATNYGKLYKFLLSKHLSNRPGKANSDRISTTDCYEKCIFEWNAWCSKNRHNTLRIKDKSAEAIAA